MNKDKDKDKNMNININMKNSAHERRKYGLNSPFNINTSLYDRNQSISKLLTNIIS